MAPQRHPSAIERRIQPKYKTRNEAIIANLRAEAGADAPINPEMAIKKKTAELAYLLALHHGGDWRPAINSDSGFVVIARQPPTTRT